MTTKQKLVALCTQHNIDLKDEVYISSIHSEDVYDVDVWSPKGFMFVDTGCHCIVVNAAKFESTRNEVRQEAIERINAGLVPCDNIDCDTCNDY